jgi:CRISPR-associated exonuclease Cas4
MESDKNNFLVLENRLIDPNIKTPFRVTDLKQWVYCPRILYFYTCLPDIRPITYKMQAGTEAGQKEGEREVRRSLRAYGLEEGQREFNVALRSERLGLRGEVDMVIRLENTHKHTETIPVDYKLATKAGAHFKLQLMAYGLLLEEYSGCIAKRGFLYFIPLRRAEEVEFTKALREKTLRTIEAMQRMLWREEMPESTSQRGKCIACEFRRFCNDVI